MVVRLKILVRVWDYLSVWVKVHPKLGFGTQNKG